MESHHCERNSQYITVRKLDLNIHVIAYERLGGRRNSGSTRDSACGGRTSHNLLGRNEMGASCCAKHSRRRFTRRAHGWYVEISILHIPYRWMGCWFSRCASCDDTPLGWHSVGTRLALSISARRNPTHTFLRIHDLDTERLGRWWQP